MRDATYNVKSPRGNRAEEASFSRRASDVQKRNYASVSRARARARLLSSSRKRSCPRRSCRRDPRVDLITAQCFCVALALRSTEKSRSEINCSRTLRRRGCVTSVDTRNRCGVKWRQVAAGFSRFPREDSDAEYTRTRRARRSSTLGARFCSARTETREQREQQNIGFTAIGLGDSMKIMDPWDLYVWNLDRGSVAVARVAIAMITSNSEVFRRHS